MNNESTTNQGYTSSNGVRWIKGASGTTYLCGSESQADGRDEAKLSAECQDESDNPQNS